MTADHVSIYVYFGLVFLVTFATLMVTSLFTWKKGPSEPSKFLPYESGILKETHLFRERFSLHHYLIALLFLVFDIEVIFLYPWATIAKQLGSFAFYEMGFFLLATVVAFIYAWRKGGLQWE